MGPKSREEREIELLEICFDTFCKHGLENTSLLMLSEACGVTNGALVYYFGTKENIVVESTALCMARVENDFMAQSPKSLDDLERFLVEMPRMTAELHGAKYRFMYQVYASPRYREHGVEFFRGVNVRYQEYADTVSKRLGLPADYTRGMIYIFVRACVHYAMFGDEEYLEMQLGAIRTSVGMFLRHKDEQDARWTPI